MVKITCVVENTATFASEFYAEHGLSILIEDGKTKVLFDTGNSPEVLKKNMGLLNGFKDLNYVVLSHGHDDHTGGLSYIFKNTSADILMHEKALLPKYVLRKGKMQFIGTKGEYITKNSSKHVNNDQKTNDSTKVEFISKTIEIAPNIYIFPEISLKYDFEGIDPSFLICDNGNFLSDNFEDELVLVIRTDKGLVVLSGCAHRGIVNTVSSVVEYFNDDIYAVIGGTHLVSSNEDRLNRTSKELKKFDPDQLIFGHCNGFDAQCRFKKEFKNKFQILESGKEINII